MSGFSTGEEVRIMGHPERFGWMAEIAGKKGEVVEAAEKAVRVRISEAFDGEPHWIGLGYVEKAESEAA
jgi:ribosomal protein L21E